MMTKRIVKCLFQRHDEFVNQIFHQCELIEIDLNTQTIKIRIKKLKILSIEYDQISIFSTYVTLMI